MHVAYRASSESFSSRQAAQSAAVAASVTARPLRESVGGGECVTSLLSCSARKGRDLISDSHMTYDSAALCRLQGYD